MISTWRVQQAARAIRAGAVIAYPTEAVWGLGCDPWDEDAVERLLAIKSRPVDKGLILVADNIHQFDFLFEDFPQAWIDRMASTWPGPNTWLVPHQGLLPDWITGNQLRPSTTLNEKPPSQTSFVTRGGASWVFSRISTGITVSSAWRTHSGTPFFM